MNKRILLLIMLAVGGLQRCTNTPLAAGEGGSSVEVSGITGCIVDSTRTPVAQGSIALYRRSVRPQSDTTSPAGSDTLELETTLYSASNGTFATGTLKAGSYLLRVTKRGAGSGMGLDTLLKLSSAPLQLDTMTARALASCSGIFAFNRTAALLAEYPLFLSIYKQIGTEKVWLRTVHLQDSAVLRPFHLADLSPGTYTLKAILGAYNNYGALPTLLLDTTLVMHAGHHLQLDTIGLYEHSALSSTAFRQDSAAAMFIATQSDTGAIDFSDMRDWLDPRSGRLLDLGIRSTNGCSFNAVADALASLDKLRSLTLEGFSGDTLPTALCQLTNLRTLLISYGTLSHLPEGLIRPTLRTLAMNSQNFTTIPPALLTPRSGMRLYVILNNNPIGPVDCQLQQRINTAFANGIEFSDFPPTAPLECADTLPGAVQQGEARR